MFYGTTTTDDRHSRCRHSPRLLPAIFFKQRHKMWNTVQRSLRATSHLSDQSFGLFIIRLYFDSGTCAIIYNEIWLPTTYLKTIFLLEPIILRLTIRWHLNKQSEWRNLGLIVFRIGGICHTAPLGMSITGRTGRRGAGVAVTPAGLAAYLQPPLDGWHFWELGGDQDQSMTL